MALRRGFGGSGTIVSGDGLSSGPKSFWLPGGTETIITLLDDIPAEVVMHVQYLKGDKKGNGMRVTCFGLDPVVNQDPCPRECEGCNAMLRHDRIARKHFCYLTLIDERAFEYEGKHYKDMKRTLELTPDAADLFERRRKAQGSLVGSRWRVYRSKSQRAARIGDDWNFLGYVDEANARDPIETRLMRHFWQSPAIPNIRKNAQEYEKKVLDHAGAAAQLIKPYDFDDLYGTFDPKKMAAFVAYHESAVGATSRTASAGGGYQAPPPPPGTAPTGPSYGAPAAMPTGAAPATPQPAAAAPMPAQPQPAAAAGAAATGPWPDQGTQQAFQQHAQAQPAAAAPPAVPDPAPPGAAAPAQPYAAPPFPGAAPAPSATPQPQAAATPAPGAPMPGAGFNFGPQPAAAAPQPNQPNGFPAEPFGTS